MFRQKLVFKVRLFKVLHRTGRVLIVQRFSTEQLFDMNESKGVTGVSNQHNLLGYRSHSVQQTYFKSRKCIRGNVKCGHFNISEEVVELLWPQCDFSQRFMSDALPQHDTTVQGNVWRLVPAGNSNIKTRNEHVADVSVLFQISLLSIQYSCSENVAYWAVWQWKSNHF